MDCDKCYKKVIGSEQQNVLETKEVLIFHINQLDDHGEKLSTEVEINPTIFAQGNTFQLCSVIVHCCEGKYKDETGGHFVILYTLTGKLDDLLCMDNNDIYEFYGSALMHEFVTENVFLVTYQKLD